MSLDILVCFERLVPVSGQRFRLQERYLTRTPWQYLPPFDGTGLLHSLLDSWAPPPHVREQEPNVPHLPQRPSTWKYTNQRHIAESIITKTFLNHTLVKVCVDIKNSWCEPYLHILDLLVGTDPSVADLSVPTVSAIRPGEVPSHTHQMAVGFSCAPQAATWWLHKGTGLGAFSERELTLAVEVV